MPILTVTDIVKYFGGDRVLAGVTLELEKGRKAALVGRNGCGKTTLLRIIAGLEEADRGVVHLARGSQVGFLTQSYQCMAPDNTLWAEMETVFTDLNTLAGELENLAAALAGDRHGTPDTLARYAKLQEDFERQGGYTIRPRIERVLRGLGFTDDDWGKPVEVLSGGETTRAALARLLLREPDLILLDEPTNHLDLWAVTWLEEYLASYRGAVLLVSHDRYFLDRVVSQVHELTEGTIRSYSGNYTAFRRSKEAERLARESAQKAQDREIARKERLVRESASDERSKRQARSIAKSLERMNRVEHLAVEPPRLKLGLNPANQSSRIALDVVGLQKSYDGRPVLTDVAFTVESGEKIGIIGPNGSGKTTLLRLLLGLERADKGEIRRGYNVQPAYFAQGDLFTDSGTVFSVIQEAGAGDNQATRDYLARFLFRGDEVWKDVADLSGGERRRLALAALTLTRSNLLVLDEPTNHLDLPSIEALEEAITTYPGTVLVVTHDRYFLGRVTDRLLALTMGKMRHFPNYEGFAAWHQAEEARKAEIHAKVTGERREQLRKERSARQAPIREEKRRIKAIAGLESALAEREEERADLLRKMTEVAGDFCALRDLSLRLANLDKEIEHLYKEWEACVDES